MIVAFEGMDGCGKSTVASMFAEKNDFIHETQRIMRILNISREEFDNLVNIVRGSKNKKLSPIFYTFRCMLDNETDTNTVVERTMISTYYFENKRIEKDYWDFAMGLDVVPDITFVLYASPEERYNRIKNRNPLDKDLKSKEALSDGYSHMLEFIREYSIPYVGINTEIYNAKQVVEISTEIVKAFSKIEKMEDKIKFLEEMNNIYGFEKLEKDKIKKYSL